jgi:hypothetical protein
MTTTVTDAKGLYAVSSDFRMFIQIWVNERRCPLPVVDLLLEQGLEGPAEACRWAATTHARPAFSPDYELRYPFPTVDDGGFWYWFPCSYSQHNYDVPFVHVKAPSNHEQDIIDELLWLLDNWKTP